MNQRDEVRRSRTRGRDVAQPSSAVRRDPDSVRRSTDIARPGSRAYRRRLPDYQPVDVAIAITFVTWKRHPLPERVRSLVLDACLVANGARFALHAAVVMPDHVHLLLTPGRDSSGAIFPISQILNSVKGASAHAVNKALSRKGHVWQPERFDRALRSDESMRAVADYICANPVRAGLASQEHAYEWLWREWIEGAALQE